MITIMNACNWWIALCCLDLDFKKIEVKSIPVLSNSIIIVDFVIRIAEQYPWVYRCQNRAAQPLVRSASSNSRLVIFGLEYTGSHQ